MPKLLDITLAHVHKLLRSNGHILSDKVARFYQPVKLPYETKTIEIMSFKTAESIRSPNPFTGVNMSTQQQQYIQSLSFTIRKVYFHYIKDHHEQTYGKHWEYRLVPDGMDVEKWQNNLFSEGQERFGATCEIEVHQPTSRKVTHTECTASHCSNGFVSWNGNWAECSTCQDNRMISEHRLPRNRIPGFRNPY